MSIRITMVDGTVIETDTGGNSFTVYNQALISNGLYLDLAHHIWVPASQIKKVEIIS